jgi:hypothetical protein
LSIFWSDSIGATFQNISLIHRFATLLIKTVEILKNSLAGSNVRMRSKVKAKKESVIALFSLGFIYG